MSRVGSGQQEKSRVGTRVRHAAAGEAGAADEPQARAFPWGHGATRSARRASLGSASWLTPGGRPVLARFTGCALPMPRTPSPERGTSRCRAAGPPLAALFHFADDQPLDAAFALLLALDRHG